MKIKSILFTLIAITSTSSFAVTGDTAKEYEIQNQIEFTKQFEKKDREPTSINTEEEQHFQHKKSPGEIHGGGHLR